MSMKRHAERNGCQERDTPREEETSRKDMPRERETSRKRCQNFKRKKIKELACREKRMSGKRHAEIIRDLKKRTCQGKERCQEKDAKTSRERDFKEMACREKRVSGKGHVERIKDPM